MARFKRKPIVIEAEPYRPGLDEEDGIMEVPLAEMTPEMIAIAEDWYGEEVTAALDVFTSADERPDQSRLAPERGPTFKLPYLLTIEGRHFLRPMDMIITGVAKERYPIRKEIFKATYEPCPDGALPREIEEAEKRLQQLLNDYEAMRIFIPAIKARLGSLSDRWDKGERTLTLCREIVDTDLSALRES